MKTTILLLTLLVSTSFCMDGCDQNPLGLALNDLLTELDEEIDQGLKTSLQQWLQQYQSSSPTDIASNDVCPQFQDKKVCCNSTAMGAIPSILQAFYDGATKKVFKYTQFAQKINTSLDDCGLTTEQKTDFFGSELNNINNYFVDCNKEAINVSTDLIAGTICGICATNDEKDTYFADYLDTSNFNILIAENNWQLLQVALDSAMTCYSDNKEALKSQLSERFNLFPQCSDIQSSLMDDFNSEVLSANQCSPGVLTGSCNLAAATELVVTGTGFVVASSESVGLNAFVPGISTSLDEKSAFTKDVVYLTPNNNELINQDEEDLKVDDKEEVSVIGSEELLIISESEETSDEEVSDSQDESAQILSVCALVLLALLI